MVMLMTPIYCASLIFLLYASSNVMLIISGLLNGFYMLAQVTQGAITAELVPTIGNVQLFFASPLVGLGLNKLSETWYFPSRLDNQSITCYTCFTGYIIAPVL